MLPHSNNNRTLDSYDYRGYFITIYESIRASADRRYRVMLKNNYSGLEYRPSRGFPSERDARYYAEMYAETH
jgi:hypothetical protein